MTENTSEMQAAQRELEQATRRAAEIGAEQAGLDIERIGGRMDAEQVKAEMEQIQRRVERAARDVQRASDRVQRELDRQVRAMRADIERKMATVNEALEPVKKRIELMQEGVETLGLYLSAAEGVVCIRDGERAPDQEPIVIRQMVLAMDEETGMFAEEEGMTAADVDAFDEWLLADSAHVDQIVPETKGVVALVARWREREHGNPWSHDAKDKVTHFLIRNGDALFRTTVKEFIAGEVLVPRADEFIKYFFRKTYNFARTGTDREPLTPGTRDYAEAMERSDKRGRHFLRIGLILQGLVDNSDVFEPLHPAGINMLTDPSERSEKVRIITDAEGGLQSGEATFLQWQKELNEQLRPGMRIIGAFGGGPWRDANEWAGSKTYYGHSRCRPKGSGYEDPPSGVPLLIEERKPDGGLVVRYQREREIFDTSINEPVPGKPGYVYRGKHRKPKTRASATLYPYDTFILPYDLIESSAQLRRFLASRRNRADYRDLWPLIRAAMHAKAAEEKAEAPFKTMLAGVLARENGVPVADAQADVDELVRWFKLKNRWARPLTLESMTSLEAEAKAAEAAAELNERGRDGGLTPAAISARLQRAGMAADVEYDEAAYQAAVEAQEAAAFKGREHEAKAVRQIVAEHGRRLADRRRPINAKLVEQLRAQHTDALLIARPRKGGYLVLTPAHPTDNIWVHEFEYTAKGQLREQRDWRLVSADRVSRWTVAYRHDRFDSWDLHASERDHLRGPELEQLAQRMLKLTVTERGTRTSFWPTGDDAAHDEARPAHQPMMVSYMPPTPQSAGRFTLWTMTREGTPEEGPAYLAVDRWHERQNGDLTLRKSRVWYGENEHEWSLGSEPELPWKDTSYAAEHVGRIVWGPDEAVCARWVQLRSEHLRHERSERALDKRAYSLASSIKQQWKALQVNALHEAFMADVPDADWHEWTEHLKAHQPEWTWSDSHHHPHGDLGKVVRFLVSKGTDPTGWTAQHALDTARERGLPDTWDGFRGNVHRFPDAFPAEWADLVIGAEPVAEPQEPAAEPEPQPEEGVRINDDIVILDPEQPKTERDPFDTLRDTLNDL